MENKVFLGGTCAETTWRDKIIDKLSENIEYFNPVVKNWTPADQKKQIDEKENKCNIHFYCITSEMKGVFSIAEVVDSVYNKNVRTIFHVIPDGFDKAQIKSLEATVDLVNSRGSIAYVDGSLMRSVRVLNYCFG